MKDKDARTGPTGPDAAPGAAPQPQTVTAQGDRQRAVPRMPHERDESADSQASSEPSTRRMGELAQKDAERGVPDTTKGAETDQTYHRLREDLPPNEREKKFRP
jgi:hypothetical protein